MIKTNFDGKYCQNCMVSAGLTNCEPKDCVCSCHKTTEGLENWKKNDNYFDFKTIRDREKFEIWLEDLLATHASEERKASLAESRRALAEKVRGMMRDKKDCKCEPYEGCGCSVASFNEAVDQVLSILEGGK